MKLNHELGYFRLRLLNIISLFLRLPAALALLGSVLAAFWLLELHLFRWSSFLYSLLLLVHGFGISLAVLSDDRWLDRNIVNGGEVSPIQAIIEREIHREVLRREDIHFFKALLADRIEGCINQLLLLKRYI